MKRLFEFMFVAAMAWVMTMGVALAEPVTGRKEYKDIQTFRAPAVIEKELEFGDKATILSDGKNLYPHNFITNSLFGIWSGGTRYGSGGVASVPDGWRIEGPYTGTTRVDTSGLNPSSGSSIYGGLPHSVFVANWNPTTGPGTTAYLTYPSHVAGSTTAATWYAPFKGKRVVFGAAIMKPNSSAVAIGVSTPFIRPFIKTSSSEGYNGIEKGYAFGKYAGTSGWSVLTAVTTVPYGATALEVGFAMNPTALATKKDRLGTEWVGSNGGDTAFICAPFLLIDPLREEYVANPQEEVELVNPLVPWSGASVFGAKLQGAVGSTIDLSSENGWNGIIPDSAKSVYALVNALIPAGGMIHFYGDNIKSGLTIFGNDGSGGNTGITGYPVWMPVSTGGNLYIDNVAALTGVSLQVLKVKMRQ